MLEPGEQCENKSCGDDATEIIEGDAFCAVHAQMAREYMARDHGGFFVVCVE